MEFFNLNVFSHNSMCNQGNVIEEHCGNRPLFKKFVIMIKMIVLQVLISSIIFWLHILPDKITIILLPTTTDTVIFVWITSIRYYGKIVTEKRQFHIFSYLLCFKYTFWHFVFCVGYSVIISSFIGFKINNTPSPNLFAVIVRPYLVNCK